jgi:hypothetical protein
MARQYVSVVYREEDKRRYTYHNDDAPVAVGDVVKVPSARTDGWMKGFVVEVSGEEPLFPTKQIMGVVETDTPNLL